MLSAKRLLGSLLLLLAALSFDAAPVRASEVSPAVSQVDIFRSGEDGYHTYRIPALIMTRKGTLLAFCEGRKNSPSDTGDIDAVLKRSFDNGKTWSKMQIVADFGPDTIGNPAPVIEQKSGAIILLLTRNPGHENESQFVDGTAAGTRTAWITRSVDDGASWSAPEEITSSTKQPNWTWYATGPGNGIQLRTGRLVIPCDHITRDEKAPYSYVIFSDDRGQTWRLCGIAGPRMNESAIVELPDGSLLLNMRTTTKRNRRGVSHSRDEGLTWSEPALDDELIEPACQGSMIRVVLSKRSTGILFSNPADTKRVRMTVRLSLDHGNTWPAAKLIHEGPSAYSSLAEMRYELIGLLYERGESDPYERITFARFKMKWFLEAIKE